ncbi:hypothetical protein C943_03073 [Mariniradius saccharolyticus AK6]|uniref:BioF2-like acetyltransferase domain-containing protein n=1 Tax=Mariniradius saccharolyticus AK6 TaxID=1239962 RepID=M7X847_9BACT|nr:hypothetical protein C943_03073 [Mariniradius saccharolyticus AK6]
MLDTAEFRVKWDVLVRNVAFGSVFQAPNFVLPWYKGNIQEFWPVVLAAFDDGQLVGLLTLARKVHQPKGKLCNRLIGAGNFYALYQSWLVERPFIQTFWEKGINRLLDDIPGCVINLKSIQDISIYNELAGLPDFNRNTVLEKFLNPVLDFRVEGYDKIFAKRHFKSKINRLNRAGNVVFEKVISPQRLAEVFPKLATFYALRQGAAFNKTPFENNDHALSLFSSWLSEGALHMTCLWLDEALIGAIIMVNDLGKTGHLAGLIAYSPTHAKFSPGLVQLYQHAMLLKEENFQNMKLSPGYDAYKDRFSNKSEEIYELMISRNQFQLLKRRLRNRFRNTLLNRGIRPMELEVESSKWKSRVRKWPCQWWKKLSPLPVSVAELFQKLDTLKKLDDSVSMELELDNMEALLLSTDKTFDLARWEFLQDALNRLEENEHFVTWVRAGQLLCCLWYTGEMVSGEDELIEKERKGKITQVFISEKF